MDFRTLGRRFAAFMAVPDQADLLRAQYVAFSKQIPLLHALLLVNSWALAITFIPVAPILLSLYVPMLLSVVCGTRLVAWSMAAGKAVSADRARQALVRTNMLAALLAAAFCAWSISLYPYGDGVRQVHIAFYMAITVIGCIFCLMHLRSAAIIVAFIVNLVFIGFFGATGKPTFVAIAINVSLVSMAMVVMLLVYYRDFRRMIAAHGRTLTLSEENKRLANIDSLTQLPNRRQFFDALQARVAQAGADGKRLAVGVLDIDGFKPVNDVHGHAVGDGLLVQVGERLRHVCADRAQVFRLGGDEFALILDAKAGETAIQAMGADICADMAQPFMLGGARVDVSATIGFAVYPDRADDAETLFEHADYALYEGKRSRRGQITVFAQRHEANIHWHARIEQALLHADLEAELSVSFQPIVDIRRARIVGLEALARWNSATLGQVGPGDFIPIAERIGMIGKLTHVLLRKALSATSQWPEDVRLSFNLSAHDTRYQDGVEKIVEIVRASGVCPQRIDFEITETAMMGELSQVREAWQPLKALGCGLSLDDFGTGYSSLTQLLTLPLTRIKIERRFVNGIQQDPASYKIVRALLTLSRDMQLSCVVEGVETRQELEVLRHLGCVHVQGYLFSRPVPQDKVAALLRAPLPVLASG